VTLLRAILICITAMTAGLVAGFIAAGHYAEQVLMPKWVAAHPYDGQLGLAVLMYSTKGGMISAVATLAIAIYLCRRGWKRKALSDSAPPR
jgi:hypothetical protein